MAMPGTTTTHWRREVAAQALILIAILAVFFPGVFLRGEMATGADLLYKSPPWNAYTPHGFRGPGNTVMPDIVTAMLPYYVLTENALQQGQWPLWNPLEMTGLPLLANCQSAVFYPPRLLHAALDLHVATSCYYLLKLWLCGMTMFLCARGLGLGLFGARFASIAWAFNGFNLVWCYWPLPDVSAWLPVLFYGVEMAARGNVRPAIFGVASGGALMLLAGHPESAFVQALGAGIYFALRLLLGMTPPRVLLKAVFACSAGWILALGVTAVQWVPFLEYLVNSYTVHARRGDDFGNYVDIMGVVTLFVPRFLGTNAEGNFWGDNTFNLHSYYPGMLTWAGVFLAVALLRRRAARPMLGALLITALLCGLWSFGAPGVSEVFSLPGLRALRLNYNIAFAVFAACVLGAHGLEHWLEARGNRVGAVAVCMGAALACVAVYGGYQFIAPISGMMKTLGIAHAALVTAAVTAVAVVICLVASAKIPRRGVASALLLGCLFGDLFVALHGMNPTVPRDEIFVRTALTDYLKGLPQPARVQAGAGFVASGLLVPYGIEDWLGYDGMYPERILHFTEKLGEDIWIAAEPICSIPWYLRNPEIAARGEGGASVFSTKTFPANDAAYFERMTSLDGLEVFRNKKALPRAYVSGAVKAFPNSNALFEALLDKQFVPGATIYTEAPPARPLPETPGIAGTAEITKHTPNEVTIRAHADRAGVLVLSDAYFPGWRATVNGVEAPIFPAYYAFRAVLVPAGDSEVVFSYFPRSFQLGLAISTATLLFSLVSSLWVLRRL